MWALRGGGGNFGIVTEFRFRVHPVPALYAGMMMWPASEATRVLGLFCDVAPAAPRDLSLVCAQLVAPPEPFVPADLQLQPAVAIAAVWTGADRGDGPQAVAPFRAAGANARPVRRPAVSGHPAMVRCRCPARPPVPRPLRVARRARRGCGRATCGFGASPLRRRSTKCSSAGLAAPSATSTRRPPPSLPRRSLLADDRRRVGRGTDEPHVEWTRRSWDRLQPWSCGGGYVNHLAADEGGDRVRQAVRRRHVAALGATEAPLRPRQRLPPQPEHRPIRGVAGGG